MQPRGVFDEILDKVEEMDLEDQAMIIDIVRNRYRERRREEILKHVEETLEEHRKGLTSRGSVTDLLRELEE